MAEWDAIDWLLGSTGAEVGLGVGAIGLGKYVGGKASEKEILSKESLKKFLSRYAKEVGNTKVELNPQVSGGMAFPRENKILINSSDPDMLRHELGHVKGARGLPSRVRQASFEVLNDVDSSFLKKYLHSQALPFTSIPDEAMAWKEANKMTPRGEKLKMLKMALPAFGSYGLAALGKAAGLGGLGMAAYTALKD